jgi:hypothetical protein
MFFAIVLQPPAILYSRKKIPDMYIAAGKFLRYRAPLQSVKTRPRDLRSPFDTTWGHRPSTDLPPRGATDLPQTYKCKPQESHVPAFGLALSFKSGGKHIKHREAGEKMTLGKSSAKPCIKVWNQTCWWVAGELLGTYNSFITLLQKIISEMFEL